MKGFKQAMTWSDTVLKYLSWRMDEVERDEKSEARVTSKPFAASR